MKVMVAFEERVARVSVYVPEHLLASPCDAPSVTNLILNAFKSAAKKQLSVIFNLEENDPIELMVEPVFDPNDGTSCTVRQLLERGGFFAVRFAENQTNVAAATVAAVAAYAPVLSEVVHNSSILFRKSHHDSRRNQVLEHEVKRLRNAIVLGGKDDIGAIEVLEETVKEKQEMLELANRQLESALELLQELPVHCEQCLASAKRQDEKCGGGIFLLPQPWLAVVTEQQVADVTNAGADVVDLTTLSVTNTLQAAKHHLIDNQTRMMKQQLDCSKLLKEKTAIIETMRRKMHTLQQLNDSLNAKLKASKSRKQAEKQALEKQQQLEAQLEKAQEEMAKVEGRADQLQKRTEMLRGQLKRKSDEQNASEAHIRSLLSIIDHLKGQPLPSQSQTGRRNRRQAQLQIDDDVKQHTSSFDASHA